MNSRTNDSAFSMTPAQSKWVAAHEAGHVVAHWRLKIPIASATIIPDRSTGTLGMVRGCDKSPRDTAPREHLMNCLIVLYAGSAAQRVAAPRSGLCASARGDYRQADELLSALATCPDAEQALDRFAVYEARSLVKAHWHVVEAVAQALIERKTLTGAECFAIADAADERHRAALAAVRPIAANMSDKAREPISGRRYRTPRAQRRNYADAIMHVWMDRAARGACSTGERDDIIGAVVERMEAFHAPEEFRARMESWIAARRPRGTGATE